MKIARLSTPKVVTIEKHEPVSITIEGLGGPDSRARVLLGYSDTDTDGVKQTVRKKALSDKDARGILSEESDSIDRLVAAIYTKLIEAGTIKGTIEDA